MTNRFRRRRRMAYAAFSVAESLVVLFTFAQVQPAWSARYYESILRRIASERRNAHQPTTQGEPTHE